MSKEESFTDFFEIDEDVINEQNVPVVLESDIKGTPATLTITSEDEPISDDDYIDLLEQVTILKREKALLEENSTGWKNKYNKLLARWKQTAISTVSVPNKPRVIVPPSSSEIKVGESSKITAKETRDTLKKKSLADDPGDHLLNLALQKLRAGEK